MKKIVKRILTIITITLLLLGISPANVAFAATNATAPYGFTYDDSVTGRTMYKFFKYDTNKKAHVPAKTNYSIGNWVYTEKGILISKESAGAGSRYNGFDLNGKFYIVTKTGALLLNSSSFSTTEVLKTGAKYLIYNSDDLATTVVTTSGNLRLSDLKKVPEMDPGTTPKPTPKAKNRVEMYTNSANEMVYASYKENTLKTKIVVNGNKVLNETKGIRLSDTLYGAKFLGFDTSYNVYLYEANHLYRFKDGSWYTAERLTLSGNYKNFKRNDNGFITEIITKNDVSYPIKTLTSSEKWKASKTYVVSKSDYKTLYTKGSTKSHVLRVSKNKLYFDGKLITTGVTKYGFMSAKKFVFIKNKKAYTAAITSPKKFKVYKKKATKLATNSNGLVNKVS